MTYFKTRSYYFLAAILVIAISAIMIVGCERVLDQSEAETSILSKEQFKNLILPEDLENASQREIQEYLSSLSTDKLLDMYRELKLAQHLKDQDLLQQVSKEKERDQSLWEVSYSNILETDEVEKIQDVMKSVANPDPCPALRQLAIINESALFAPLPVTLITDQCTSVCQGCGVGTCTWHSTYTFLFNTGGLYTATEEDTGVCCDLGCNTCPTNAARDRAIADFLMKDVSESVRQITELYIANSGELKKILGSQDSRFQKVQEEFKEFWSVYNSLIEDSFANGKNVQLNAYQIQLAQDVLSELSKVVESPELKLSIGQIQANLHIAEGKELKEAIKAFDKADLHF